MFYSEDLIEEIRSRNDIVDVISGYVRLQKKGASYFGLCPFHNEKSPSFSVSPHKQMYYCFGCGAGGNVITFLMDMKTIHFRKRLRCWPTGQVLYCLRSPKRQKKKSRPVSVRPFLKLTSWRQNILLSAVSASGGDSQKVSGRQKA